VPGLINLDFADVRRIMKDAGPAWMSIGQAKGENRAIEAARQALSSPLLDVSMQGAKGVLFNISGNNLTLPEVNNAAEVIQKSVDPEANVIFGVVLDENMGENVRLTLIATGFATRETTTGAKKDRELEQLLKGIGEDELNMPAYLRQHQRYQARQPKVMSKSYN
jgi:cell division protein FtsZ